MKYWAARRMSPKTYWHLMGKLRSIPAVTSGYASAEQCLASGESVVTLLEHLDVLGPDIVTLHIGSGLGRVEYHLRSRVRECYGVDVSPSMVKRAQALVPYDNVKFRETDGATLSEWPAGSFNLIYSFLVFQHLPRTQFDRYLAEAYDKLSSGGHLVFQILIDENGSRPDPPATHPYGIRYYRRDDVQRMLTSVGFSQPTLTDLAGKADDGSWEADDIVFHAIKP